MTGAEIAGKAAEATAAIAGLVAAAAPVTAPAMGAIAALALAAGGIAKAIAAGDGPGAEAALEEARRALEKVANEKERHFEERNAATRAELERLAGEKGGTP